MLNILKPIRLGYVTAIWGREWLTRTIFKNIALLRASLAPTIELVISVAGSEGEKSKKLVSEFDFKYIEVPNTPLGAKWNAALMLLKEEVDGVCIFGSDDLVNIKYFRQLAEEIQRGEQLVGLSGLYFYDQPTNRLLYWQGYPPSRQNEAAGAGRFIGRKVLEKLEWILWPPLLPAGLDKGMRERLKDAGFSLTKLIPCEDNGAVVMDIKGYGGMNNFEQVAASGPSMLCGNPATFIIENFGSDIASLFHKAPLPQRKCSDSWLWTIQKETEQINISCIGIWHIEHAFLYSSEQDFLLACTQAGIYVKTCSLSEFLDFNANSTRKEQYVYGALTGESLFAMLGTRLPKILDFRSIEAEIYRNDAIKLPVILAGCTLKNHKTLPLPFSIPPSFPCFEQRANIVMCVGDSQILEQFHLLFEKCFDAQIMKIFSIKNNNQTSKYNNILTREQLFPLRTSFRVVIFTASEWEEAAYFISGGTPGICLGNWVYGDCPNGIYIVNSLTEALSTAIRLLTDKTFWKTASSRTRFYSRQQFKHFKKALQSLFTAS